MIEIRWLVSEYKQVAEGQWASDPNKQYQTVRVKKLQYRFMQLQTDEQGKCMLAGWSEWIDVPDIKDEVDDG